MEGQFFTLETVSNSVNEIAIIVKVVTCSYERIYCFLYVGPNASKSIGPTTDGHSKSDKTDGSSFWSSFNTLKPATHSTPKVGHSQPSSTDSLSFNEDSHWGAYFSPPQATSVNSTPKRSNSLENSLSKDDKTSPKLSESSEAAQSLPSPTIKSSKSGPLKLGSSKAKNRPKAKQVDSVKPDTQCSDSAVTKESVTSSSESFTTVSSINVSEKQQQKSEDGCIHASSGDDQTVQPVTTSELLLLASAENTEVSSSSNGNVNRVTENQPDTPGVPVQPLITEDVDSTHAVLPTATTSPPADSQPVTNEVNVAVDEVDSGMVKSETDSTKETGSNKEIVSSSISAMLVENSDVITTPQSDEISSTAEYVIVSKETVTDKPTASDTSEQLTELSQTTAGLTSNSTTEQKDLLWEEDKEKQKEQVSDGHSVEMQKAKDDNKESCLLTTDVIPNVVDDGNQGSDDLKSHDYNYEEELRELKSVSVSHVCMHLC